MFNFGLQSVLDCRKAVEEKVLVEFSEQKRRLEREKEILAKLRKERMLLIEQFKQKQKTVLNAADIALYISCIIKLQEREADQQGLVREVIAGLEIKREELLEAVKKAKIMETLRSQQLQEYETNILTLERKASDEMAILRFDRRQK
ncbi:MAG: flagellar export protein FliJ [Deltaproteobacteria bacterium]|nr:flagellar export protein FliJ [Deltaproteobacteria bacterium]